jgi:hypothetical protein
VGKKVVENDVNKRYTMGVGESNKTMQQDLHIFGKPITTHHSSDSTWLHNTLALLISRNPQWLSCSVPGRRADWESFCRSLERSLDVNNKPDFGESKPKDHDILATVPAVPGCAFPRYPQDWGDTGFGIILGNGCSKNFLNPKHRSSNAKYDRSCSFDILFDIPNHLLSTHFESRLSLHFQRWLPLQAPATEIFPTAGGYAARPIFICMGRCTPKRVPCDTSARGDINEIQK